VALLSPPASNGPLLHPGGERGGQKRYELSGILVAGIRFFRTQPQMVALLQRSRSMTSVVVSMVFLLRKVSIIVSFGVVAVRVMKINTATGVRPILLRGILRKNSIHPLESDQIANQHPNWIFCSGFPKASSSRLIKGA
jgi:hypothetical protein